MKNYQSMQVRLERKHATILYHDANLAIQADGSRAPAFLIGPSVLQKNASAPAAIAAFFQDQIWLRYLASSQYAEIGLSVLK